MSGLYWLPEDPAWPDRLRALHSSGGDASAEAFAMARCRMDFLRTNRLDKAASSIDALKAAAAGQFRLAILGSSTFDHLLPAIRVAGLRYSLFIETFLPEYGTYQQALMESDSALWRFAPTAVLFAFDQAHLLSAARADMTSDEADALIDAISARLLNNWRIVRQRSPALILQQTVLPVSPPLIGQNERRLPGSQHALAHRLNETIARLAASENVLAVAVHESAAQDGLSLWHDPALWHRAKQEIRPVVAPEYGDLVARLLAAALGRSRKCLVLDLDNTLWSGVIGDDGLGGIVLGQGSASGEAHSAFQRYALELSRRGVILAVCSKNDEANAIEPFNAHPEMVLKTSDIACFVANWDDKAQNLRRIAERLNIGIDSLVFVDDNPFERQIVRRELPMVAVPELPEDPASWPQCIADAGYFEAISVTSEDLTRAQSYQANSAREATMAEASDVESYLRTLDMRLQWQPFSPIDLQRVVQLINKTNQFNLMTRRYTQAEVESLLQQEGVVTLQMRLVDAFGDNGIIAILIGSPDAGNRRSLIVDTWLMSCRVLGRRVEEASTELLVREAKRLGYEEIIGQYRKSPKNGMVENHYEKLGFSSFEGGEDDVVRYRLDLRDYQAVEVPMRMERVGNE